LSADADEHGLGRGQLELGGDGVVAFEQERTQPQAYVGGVNKLVNEQGQLTNDDTKGFLTKIMQDFGSWIGATAVKA
jgi:hypothetical protein